MVKLQPKLKTAIIQNGYYGYTLPLLKLSRRITLTAINRPSLKANDSWCRNCLLCSSFSLKCSNLIHVTCEFHALHLAAEII